jgi:hypothetical protein
MLTLLEPEMLWLITINILLGLAIILCIVLVVLNLTREVRSNRKKRKAVAQVPDNYLAGLKDLGVTLPDGGKRIDEMDEEEEN